MAWPKEASAKGGKARLGVRKIYDPEFLATIARLRTEGVSCKLIARKLKIARSSVYRMLEKIDSL